MEIVSPTISRAHSPGTWTKSGTRIERTPVLRLFHFLLRSTLVLHPSKSITTGSGMPGRRRFVRMALSGNQGLSSRESLLTPTWGCWQWPRTTVGPTTTQTSSLTTNFVKKRSCSLPHLKSKRQVLSYSEPAVLTTDECTACYGTISRMPASEKTYSQSRSQFSNQLQPSRCFGTRMMEWNNVRCLHCRCPPERDQVGQNRRLDHFDCLSQSGAPRHLPPPVRRPCSSPPPFAISARSARVKFRVGTQHRNFDLLSYGQVRGFHRSEPMGRAK
jgi:hypothetical protein